jgi:hypothetical protein
MMDKNLGAYRTQAPNMVSWGKEIRDGGFGVTEIRGTIAAKQGEEQINPHEMNQRQLMYSRFEK